MSGATSGQLSPDGFWRCRRRTRCCLRHSRMSWLQTGRC